MLKTITLILIMSSLRIGAKSFEKDLFYVNDTTFLDYINSCEFQNPELSSTARLKAGYQLDSCLNYGLKAGWVENIFLQKGNLPNGLLYTISEDGKIQTFTWAVPMERGEYKFFGQVLLRMRSKTRVQKLFDADTFDDYDALNQKKWPGGLIYHIEAKHYRKNMYYLALTYRPHGVNPQMKIIEPLVLGHKNIYFGAPVFSVLNFNDKHFAKPPSRLILSFSPNISASIRNGNRNGEILIDRLAPMKSGTLANYLDYGPTLSTDILFFKKGKWLIKSSDK